MTGLEGAQMQTGKEIAPQTDAAVSAYLEIMQALGEQQMADDLQFINLQERPMCASAAADALTCASARWTRPSYRIRFAQTVMSERLSPSDIGRLYWDDEGRMHFCARDARRSRVRAAFRVRRMR